MKIAFIHFYTLRLPRGIETLVISLANELSERGHDISILTARTSGAKTSVPISERVTLKQFPVFRYYEHRTIQPFYARDLVANDYDAAIVFFPDFGEKALLRVHDRVRTKIVAYWCYGIDNVPHRYYSYRTCGLEAITDLMLADSAFVAEGAAQYFDRNVSVVPVGTDSVYYAPNANLRTQQRAKWGVGDNDFVLVNVAALERAKGAHLVVDALAQLSDEVPRLHFMIYGTGDERMRLEERVADVGLSDRVRFFGNVSDLLPIYCGADCFILLSEAEANSVAMHEAMSCGVPIIASDTGGAPEVIGETNGYLVDREKPNSIQEAIRRLASDPAIRSSMGSAARATIETGLTWKDSAEKLQQLLNNLIGSDQ